MRVCAQADQHKDPKITPGSVGNNNDAKECPASVTKSISQGSFPQVVLIISQFLSLLCQVVWGVAWRSSRRGGGAQEQCDGPVQPLLLPCQCPL